MELSSLTSVTSSSTRGANTGNSASKETASAPFADVMQRAAGAEKPQRSAAGGSSASQATNTTERSNTQEADDASSALASSRQATKDSQAADAESDATRQTSEDAREILQALEEGDMAGLHAVLASLEGKTDGKATSNAKASDSDAGPIDAEDLAAIIAALPLTTGAQPAGNASAAAAGNGAATLGAGQSTLQQMTLTASDAARSVAAMLSGKVSDDGEQPGASTRVNATSGQPRLGELLSAIEGNRSGNPTSSSSSGLLAAAGQVLSQSPSTGDPAGAALTNALADALSASGAERDGLDSALFTSPRPDGGSLTHLASPLSNGTGLASAAAVTNGAISTPVQSPQWPASFGQQILQMHQRGDQQMSLRLHPQELGPLSVSLTVQDQQAQLQILSAHAPVRAAVEAAMPQLRQALADSGIALGEAMVGDQGQFQQGQSSDDDRPRGTSSASGPLLAASGVDTSDDATLRQVALTPNGNISLYA
ncbi:flagellar hook-length control protein FliK [Salinicola sp. 4072]|uniref:flagellar hook-length control protein FliK n=1 Tax=Salinicola sp. 4072 TaxID=3082157 RepID=UPI002FCB5409